MMKDTTNSGGFWSRLSKKDKLVIVVIAIEVGISIALSLVNLIHFSDIKYRFTILTTNIVALVALLKVTIGRFLEEQDKRFNKLSTQIAEAKASILKPYNEVRTYSIKCEINRNISDQELFMKEFLLAKLDTYTKELNNLLNTKRSGPLETKDYYDSLHRVADFIEEDKRLSDTNGSESDYKGKIWALTFLLNDEWKEENEKEGSWLSRLEALDKSGIPTSRLWIFDEQRLNLVRDDSYFKEGCELLEKLSKFCRNEKDYINTTSRAVMKKVVDEHLIFFGKGFFATAESNGKLRLIRDDCPQSSYATSDSLIGEIEFNEEDIEKVRGFWEFHFNNAKCLNEFLYNHACQATRDHMTKNGYI